MQSKRLRLWIIVGSAVAVIMGVVLFFSLNFRLKTVDVEFQSRLTQEETKLEQGVQDKISNYFEYKDNIILMKFDDVISKIEKDIPFVKVNQVIKYFPRTVRVFISERIPKYRVKENTETNEWLILDEDFKILDKVTEENLYTKLYRNASYFEKTIEISNDIMNVSGSVGGFISNQETVKQNLNNIMSGVYGRTEDYLVVNKISVINNDGNVHYNIIMRNNAISDGNGCNIILEGTNDLTKMALIGITTFESEIQKDSTMNIAETIIRIYYSNGEYKGIRVSDI